MLTSLATRIGLHCCWPLSKLLQNWCFDCERLTRRFTYQVKCKVVDCAGFRAWCPDRVLNDKESDLNSLGHHAAPTRCAEIIVQLSA